MHIESTQHYEITYKDHLLFLHNNQYMHVVLLHEQPKC